MNNKLIAPKGFRFAAAHAGFRKQERDDVGLIVSDIPATAAGVFTLNRFPAAPVLVAKEVLQASKNAQAILINSGQANACTGDEGIAKCHETLAMLAKEAALPKASILPASTGVIGNQLMMDKWATVMPRLVAGLDKGTAEDFAKAIMTTDAFPKIQSCELVLPSGTVRLLALAKGAGMICPHMATMLAVVLCDADIPAKDWQALFTNAVEYSFNRVSVDGDTSTNDTVFGLTNGASKVTIKQGSAEYELLQESLNTLLNTIAYMLVQDGEGATKVARIHVTGACSDKAAELVARTVGHSPLVKTALFGEDANWGRIVVAIGRSGADFDPMEVRVSLCGIELFRDGQPTKAPDNTNFDDMLAEPLSQRDISIDITLGHGTGTYTLLASDLTHAYVDCNASYRT